jgi:hypothetical protein
MTYQNSTKNQLQAPPYQSKTPKKQPLHIQSKYLTKRHNNQIPIEGK